jgi:hypothetical protein
MGKSISKLILSFPSSALSAPLRFFIQPLKLMRSTTTKPHTKNSSLVYRRFEIYEY